MGVPCIATAGPPLREAFRKQFEADFDHFLRLRARELAVNGLLLIIVPGSLGGSHCGEGGMVAMSDAANELAAEGRIDASLLESLLFPIYLPTEDVRRLCTPPLLHAGLACSRVQQESRCMSCMPGQEMEAAAHRSGSWEVLQRGGAALTQVHILRPSLHAILGA
jgi:hypothetical protein